MFDTNNSGPDKGEFLVYIVFAICNAGFSISRRTLHKMPKICTYVIYSTKFLPCLVMHVRVIYQFALVINYARS